MIYSLDTNACVRHLNGSSRHVSRRLRIHGPQEIIVCSVVRAELLFGAVKSSNPLRSWAAHEHFLSQYACVEFDEPSAQVFARLRFDLERTGASIGPYDLQIAAIAVAHGLTLITHNVKEFSRVNGLKLVDWEA